MQYEGTTCLVTGASSGLGAEFAEQLAARGADVVLVARRRERLEALAARLRADHGVRALPVVQDLAAPGAAAEVGRAVDAAGLRPDTLVNAAGFSTFGLFERLDPAREAEQVAVDVAAVVALTRRFLPGMTASGRGALVTLASTGSFQPLPGQAVYGASKAFVLSFTEALAHETRPSGLRVLALCPGPVDTEFFQVSDERIARGRRRRTPAQEVTHALGLLDRRRTPPSTVTGAVNRLQALAAPRLPRHLVLRLAGRRFEAAERAGANRPDGR